MRAGLATISLNFLAESQILSLPARPNLVDNELYGNELVFVLSFISSNTNVEAAEQFIPLYTKYSCDFSGLPTSPRNSGNDD